MKRYVAYIFAVLSFAWMVSCSVDEGLTNPNEAGRVALQFQSSSMTRSAGDDALNENKLVSLDCYFYPTTGTGDDAKWHYRVELKDGAERLDTQTPGVYTIENELMPTGEMSNVFGSGANGSGVLYVIANYPNDDLPSGSNLTGSSIADLKQKIVTTVWSQGVNWQAQSSFVMDGQVTVNKSGTNITGTVELIRSAAKIELTISSVEASAKNGDKVYVPALGENGETIGLTMHQAATQSQIANDWKNSALTYNADANSHISLAGYTFQKGAGTTYTQINPFYSYPTHWGAGPSGETYLLLVVPWQEVETNADGSVKVDDNGVAIPKEGTKPQSCYYEIPIGKLSDGNVISEHIERNRHYQISINIGTLGSFVEEKPVTLEPSYMVVNWTNGDIEAQIKDQQYLVVDETNVEIFNQNVYDIAYASSHPVSAVITKITKPNYSKATAATVTIYNQSDGATTVTPASTISGNKESFTVSIVDGKVRLSHVLNNNNTSDGFDYVPYDITVVVTNDADMSQTITYKQYPEMYISVTLNTDYSNDNDDNGNRGFAWVNNSRTTLGDLDGFGAGSNSNPNMITITTTALGADSDYIVGDPRVSTINNLNYNNWANVKDINGTTRQLLYYYPTDTSTAASNMISPQFRIASSYGVTSGISFDNAQRRCASYQEDGYPAGRWRVPTTAELKYIVQLSAKGYITILFNNGGNYWAADKKIWVPNSSSGTVTQGSGSSAYVRCVYDDWYWGSERLTTPGATTLTSFTWGDMPR